MSDWAGWARYEHEEEELRRHYLFVEPALRGALDAISRANREYGTLGLALYRAWMQEGFWNVDAEQTGRGVELSGPLVPPNFHPEPLELVAEGAPVIDFSHDHPSWVDASLAPGGDRHFGFRALLPDIDFRGTSRAIRLYIESPAVKNGLPSWQDYWILPCSSPIPGPENLQRISGGTDIGSFILHGSSFFQKLKLVANLYGRGFEKHQRILDWGCGCGRMARYFAGCSSHTLTGVDIDPINIEWCQKNLPFGCFSTIDPKKPLQFRNESFDLIYGNSVFTHLHEKDQDFWLSQIGRLLSPEGLAVVTVHAKHSWVRNARFEMESLLKLLTDGILVSDIPNPDLSDVVGDYYVDTAHDTEYIWRHWSEFVRVINIIESFTGDLAAVILRKKMSRDLP
jgi:SAM-dependent methyltransferase